MNDHPSPLSHMDDERSSSPKRKKIRQKYAPKACVSCRRSKLKCTGENPCQRCVDNGKRCFYSEDQTAAEVLQNLSRPTPTSSSQPSYHNGNGASRRNIVHRNEAVERRPSDASVMGMSMESRMARIEAMMEALIQDRGLTFTPGGSIEREENGSDGFRSESAFPMPLLDPIHPALQQMGQPSPEHMLPPTLATNPAMDADAMPSIRVGNRSLPFPDPARYQQYVARFFGDVHLRYPCVNEDDFNTRTQQLMTSALAEQNDTQFLALCYLVFACCDVLLEVTSPTASDIVKSAGWHWYELADSLIDMKCSLGDGGLTVVQCLLFKAIYLTYADIPALAYTAIRMACTAVLQQNLHRQASWTGLDAERTYLRLCVFWTVYIADQSISISCGRPASIYCSDISVETPEAYCSRVPFPKESSDDIARRNYSNKYLNYMIWSVRLAVEAATESFAKSINFCNINQSRNASLMIDYINHQLPNLRIPNLPPQDTLNQTLKGLMALRREYMPLLAGRRIMTNLTYDNNQLPAFDLFASHTLKEVRALRSSSTDSYRHHITSAVAGVLLTSGAILFRLHSLHAYCFRPEMSVSIDTFVESAGLLTELAQGLQYAKRVLEDCSNIIDVGMAVINRHQSLSHAQQAGKEFSSVAEVVPPNVAESFPYQALSPPLQRVEGWEGLELVASGRGSGVLWLF